MKTIEQMQAAVDAIRIVCNQHGIVLIGACYSEGIHGEIDLVDAAEVIGVDLNRLTNAVEVRDHQSMHVLGIGDATKG
jgi:hypothetical protein